MCRPSSDFMQLRFPDYGNDDILDYCVFIFYLGIGSNNVCFKFIMLTAFYVKHLKCLNLSQPNLNFSRCRYEIQLDTTLIVCGSALPISCDNDRYR